jgi:quercetin dioxygenase-like cupin family protein
MYEERTDPHLWHEHNRGALAITVSALAPHETGPPLHVQPTLDASFYVLEGKVAFRVGDTQFTALAGASVLAPRGIPYTYANHYAEAARVLIICTPADEVAETVDEVRARTTERGPIHQTDIVGPPLDR